ncbi:MAG: bifunctional metallophosphatase/5'-nucleotidase [Bacteroidales bacterium]|nr:bifunctional metallophosphatase/5'-nucleotidase [Bacteroidales bacterium]
MRTTVKLHIALLLAAITLLPGCHQKAEGPQRPLSPVVILFDNDVHCGVDGYAAMETLQQASKGRTPYVAIVSCGDFAQGDVIGSVSRGEHIVDIMNLVGYDFITLGNHEFDYGIQRMAELTEKLQARTLCANFKDIQAGELVYKPFEIERYGNVDIAFLGIATPATATSVSPKIFLDEQGNIKYSFLRQTFFESIQQQVDAARMQGADYVVALSHLGDLSDGENPTSVELIGKTTGIDVVLDGHAHSVIPDSLILNAQGTPVLLASTGTKFEHIGVLELSVEGKFASTLVAAEGVQKDAGVQNFVESIKGQVLAEGERVIGENMQLLAANDPQGNRLVRMQETAIGNFCADAFQVMLGTEIAMINGGGIRADIPAGTVTFNTLYSVFPFNNTACTVSATGQQLLDILEVSVMSLPGEDGSFMQVSGLKFVVDPSVATPVVLDANNLFSHVTEGAPRRVSDVQILDAATGEYTSLLPDKTYTIGGISYNLTEYGSWGMFRYTTLLQNNLGQDVDILTGYLQQELGGVIDSRYAAPEGRITIK